MNPAALLGFAMKAGRLVVGRAAVERAMRSGQVRLLLLARDGSERLTSRMRRLAEELNVQVAVWGDKETLGAAVGKRDPGVVAVTETGFANALLQRVQPGAGAEETSWKGLGDADDKGARL